MQTASETFLNRKQILESDYFKRNDLKKADKICGRISRYYKKRGEQNTFVEEDMDTLDYRNTFDKIDALHLKNYQNHAVVYRR